MARFHPLTAPVADLIVEAADRFVLPRYRRLSASDIALKAPLDYVTCVDQDVEIFLRARLHGLLADSVTVGEEGTHANPALLDSVSDARVWLIDPLDGTRNFVEGRPDFAIMVCLLIDGVAEIGWIYFPILGKLVVAVRRGGVSINGLPAQQPRQIEAVPDGVIVQSGMPPVFGEALAARLAPVGRAGAELFSAAADCLALLEGRLDFAVYWRNLAWDHAPCCLALTEIGGACLRFDGSAYRPGERKDGLVVAVDPSLAERLVRFASPAAACRHAAAIGLHGAPSPIVAVE